MVTSDHADLSRASSIASHVPRCTKLSLPAVDCLLQVRHPPLRDRPGGVGPRGEASAPEPASLASVRSVWVARTPRACPERASRVQRLARRPIRPSWACRSWVRCACPAASPDAWNGWYFTYTSSGHVCIVFAILTELSHMCLHRRPVETAVFACRADNLASKSAFNATLRSVKIRFPGHLMRTIGSRAA